MTAPLDLEALAALHAKATAGEWHTCLVENAIYTDTSSLDIFTEGDNCANNLFAAAALHNTFPSLYAELTALRAMEARLLSDEAVEALGERVFEGGYAHIGHTTAYGAMVAAIAAAKVQP